MKMSIFNFTKKRQSIDFDANSFNRLKEYKEEHNYSSNSALLNRLIDTFTTLDPEVMYDLARFCQTRKRELAQAKTGAGDIVSQAHQANRMAQYTGLQLFFTSGEPFTESDPEPAMRRIDLAPGRGYVIFPEDWVVLNENSAKFSSYVYVMETRNHKEYQMPHILVFSEKEKLSDDDCDMFTKAIKGMDQHYNDVLARSIELRKGSDGMFINSEEHLASPYPGYFRIMDSGLPYADYPYNAMVIREGN